MSDQRTKHPLTSCEHQVQMNPKRKKKDFKKEINLIDKLIA